jgi:hypothetical protein
MMTRRLPFQRGEKLVDIATGKLFVLVSREERNDYFHGRTWPTMEEHYYKAKGFKRVSLLLEQVWTP